MNSSPVIKKDSKKKIRVEFERTPLKERLKAKFVNAAFLANVIWYVFRFVLLLGIAYIVLFPFYSKIAGSFMAAEDFADATVMLIPKNFSVDIYKYVLLENHYFEAFGNTLLLSVSTALIQTFICALIAYGLAKFRFKGSTAVFFGVILSMIIPHATLRQSMFSTFRDFDILGIVKLIRGDDFNLLYTYWPLIILSVTGLAFKNGLYIFMLRQFFKGVPDELEESAYIDGSGVFRTFIQIILPLSVPMLITVFLFAFSWQWTDNFYIKNFVTMPGGLEDSQIWLMSNIYNLIPRTLTAMYGDGKHDAIWQFYKPAIQNTTALLIMLPLIVMYLFCQKFLVQGIERSGITG